MRMGRLLYVTLCLCLLGAAAAVCLEMKWLGYVAGTPLTAYLPWHLVITITPFGILASCALASGRRGRFLLASCACAALAASMWVFACLVPVTDKRDPDFEVL